MSLDKRYIVLNSLLVLTMVSSGCRTIKSVTLPKSQSFSENPFCDPQAQKILICTVRDVVSRAGTKKGEVTRSPLASLPKVTMAIYPNNQDKAWADGVLSQHLVELDSNQVRLALVAIELKMG